MCGHFLQSFGYFCRVTKIIVPDRFEVIVQFIHQRLSGRYVQQGDILVTDVVEFLDKSTQAVAMCRDQDAFAFPDFRSEVLGSPGKSGSAAVS